LISIGYIIILLSIPIVKEDKDVYNGFKDKGARRHSYHRVRCLKTPGRVSFKDRGATAQGALPNCAETRNFKGL
jgi:hypothetical protein